MNNVDCSRTDYAYWKHLGLKNGFYLFVLVRGECANICSRHRTTSDLRILPLILPSDLEISKFGETATSTTSWLFNNMIQIH